jgi:hypothetical protein
VYRVTFIKTMCEPSLLTLIFFFGVQIWVSHLGEELTMGWPEGVGPSSGGGKFTATLARGTIEAAPEQVFSLFNDNDLVSEYNEFCTEITDVVMLDDDTR